MKDATLRDDLGLLKIVVLVVDNMSTCQLVENFLCFE